MSRTVPWSIKDVSFDARQLARDAAQRSGVTVGDWLDALIADHASDALMVPAAKVMSADATTSRKAGTLAVETVTMEPSYEFAATGTDGPSRRFAVGQRQTVHVFDTQAMAGRDQESRSAASAAVEPARPSSASKAVPSTPEDGRMKEQMIRDAVAAITRRQAFLEAGLPPRDTLPPLPDLPPEGATLGEIGNAVSALESRLALSRANRAQSANARVSPSTVGLDDEASRAFDTLGRDLRRAVQDIDQRVRPNAAARGTAPMNAPPVLEERLRDSQDLPSTTARAPQPVSSAVAPLQGLGGPAPAAEPDALLSDVRALLERLGPGSRIDTLDLRMQDLAGKMERHLGAPAAAMIEDLGRRIDALHSSVQAPGAGTQVFEQLLRGIEEKVGRTRAASADIAHLEKMMDSLASRIAESRQHPDAKALVALEAQIAKLGDRLERSEVSLSSLDAVEHSLRDLFSQLEQTRYATIDAAENAARTAARDTLRAAMQAPGVSASSDARAEVADRIAKDVQDLRQQHDASERRTQAALASLNQAVARLADHWEQANAVEPIGSPRSAAATEVSPAVSIGEPSPSYLADKRSPSVRPVPDAADALIEPGEGRAANRSRAPGVVAAGAPADGSAPFIAAARRAAQAAQASAASRQKPGSIAEGAALTASRSGSSPVALLERARTYLVDRRRPLLLSLASLVVLLGALEVARIEFDHPAGSSVAAASDTQTSVPTIETPVEDAPAKIAVNETPTAAAKSGTGAEPVAASPTSSAAPIVPAAAVPATDPAPTVVASKASPAPAVSNPFLAGLGTASTGLGDGLQALAQSGDPAAQYEVGLRYVEGRSVQRDPKIAASWFEKAATRGLAPAQYRLGSAYEKGVGEMRDPAQAVMWYARAADAGNIRAMHNLAVMSAEGAIGKPDYVKAATLFGKAATLGVRDSQFNLAILYARGLGIEQNLAQSYTWFAIAAGQGDDDAAKKRDEVAARLDAKTLEAAKAAAENFHPAPYVKTANDVVTPAGGWDAVAAPVPSKAGASKAPVM